MDLMTHIENLRAKPEHIRRRIAMGTAFGVTAIVFVFWLASFKSMISPESVDASIAVNSASTPGQSLVAGVGSFFADMRDLVFGPRKVVYSSVEVRPGR